MLKVNKGKKKKGRKSDRPTKHSDREKGNEVQERKTKRKKKKQYRKKREKRMSGPNLLCSGCRDGELKEGGGLTLTTGLRRTTEDFLVMTCLLEK